jgi:hypothetical protein
MLPVPCGTVLEVGLLASYTGAPFGFVFSYLSTTKSVQNLVL